MLAVIYFPVSYTFLKTLNFAIAALISKVNIDVITAYTHEATGINAYLIPHAARSESLSGIGVNHLVLQYRTMPITTNETAKILKKLQIVSFIKG
jgi:hypothetical protein